MDEDAIRLYLQGLLESNFYGVEVYHQPHGDQILARPCIIYVPTTREPSYANNRTYVVGRRYDITCLSDLPYGFPHDLSVIFNLPGVVVNSNRSHVTEDIVHDLFNISVNSI